MLLCKLLEGISYSLCNVHSNIDISKPVTDSREVCAQSAFVCIDGTHFKGANFANKAFESGAVVIVCCQKDKKKLEKLPLVVVSDARLCVAYMWHNFYGGKGDMRLYGITGTNGKTSTAAFLSSILKADGRSVGTIGTLGCYADERKIETRGSEIGDRACAMTTPDPAYLYYAIAEMRKAGVTDVVMEVSSHSIEQKKVAPLIFDFGIFTNLSPEHLDYHKSLEQYFSVKKQFVENCKFTITNSDDEWGAGITADAVYGVHLCEDISVSAMGVSYRLGFLGKEINVSTSVCGSFTIYNTMAAAICAVKAGVQSVFVEKGISDVHCICGRMEKVAKRDKYGFDVIIDYAHTPAAMEAVLSGLLGERIITVFGCGGERDSKKRGEMGKIACKYSKKVIVTSDNPRGESKMAIIEDIIRDLPYDNYRVIPDRYTAIKTALEEAVKEETVLLLGKGHEEYEIAEGSIHSFSERAIVKEILS